MSTTRNGKAGVGEILDLGSIVQLKVSRIRPFKDQPRRYFDPEALKNLGRSLKRRQRLPIKVKKIDDDPNFDYELVDGERRLRAAKLVDLEYLLGWVVIVKNHNEQYADSVVSNLCRSDHTALEKAEALMKLSKMGMSREAIAEECGYSLGWVDQHLSLMRLEPEVQALMDPERPKEKQLTFALALRLVPLSPDLQQQVAEEIIQKNVPVNEARFLISTRAHEAGEMTRTKRNPNKDYRIVSGFAKRLEDESKLVLGMPNPTFVSMLAVRSDAELGVLIGNITNSMANLGKLIEKLKAAKELGDQRMASSTSTPAA